MIELYIEPKQVKTAREIDFEAFWKYYNKDINKSQCQQLFLNLADDEVKKIAEHLPQYIEATPDRLYRKNPVNYLKNKCWNDAIITKRNSKDNRRLTREERIERLRNSI